MAGVHRLFSFTHICSFLSFLFAGVIPRLVLSILVLPQSVSCPNRARIPSILASPGSTHRPVLTPSHPPPSQRYIAFGTGYPHHCNALSAAGAGCPACLAAVDVADLGLLTAFLSHASLLIIRINQYLFL